MDNRLDDSEWQQMVNEIYKIARAKTHEDMRMSALRSLRSFIPFQSAVFFLTSPDTCEIIDCIIAQPLGMDISSADYERFMRAQWRRCDGGGDENEIVLSQSRVYTCQAENAVEEAPPYFKNCHMLASDLASKEGILGSLALTRMHSQGAFSKRDEFVLGVFTPYLTDALAEFRSSGRYETLEGGRLRKQWGFTNREIEVMECILYGMTTPEIGTKLGISTSTAKKHLENIYRKAGVNNRMSLMKFAQQYVGSR